MKALRSRRTQVGVALFVVAELLGLWAGWWFHQLVERVVPPGAVSHATRIGGLQLFLLRGALLGLVIFAFAVLGILAGRLFRSEIRTPSETGR